MESGLGLVDLHAVEVCLARVEHGLRLGQLLVGHGQLALRYLKLGHLGLHHLVGVRGRGRFRVEVGVGVEVGVEVGVGVEVWVGSTGRRCSPGLGLVLGFVVSGTGV